MKKILSLILSLVMLVTTVASVNLSALADNSTAITLGETKLVEITTPGEEIFFSFTPESDGRYMFCSLGDEDTYGCLYDSEMIPLDFNDDGGEGSNFMILYNFVYGETYIFGCKFSSESKVGSFNVSLTENPVASISYTPINSIEYFENSNGVLQADENDELYYCYSIPSFSNGDTFTVTDKNGNSVNYAFDDELWGFVAGNGDTIDASDLFVSEDQYTNHWTLGSDNYFTINYMDATTQVPVTIIENPVAGISFTPVKPIEIIENIDGYWNYDANDESYYHYYSPNFNAGDVLTVTDKDGNSVDYTFDNQQLNFVSDDGDMLDWGCFDRSNDQYSNHWTVGSDNYYTIEYMSKTTQVPVTILENPAASISYTPVKPIEYFENANGYWENDENNERYYCYNTPNFNAGDVLTVTDKDGNSVDYIYDSEEWEFVSVDGDMLDRNYLCSSDNQYSNHWTLGSDNYYTVEYMGAATQVPITIVENPVASISFTPVKPIEYFENTNGYWENDENDERYYCYNTPNFNAGDVLTVTDKDGNSVDYIFDDHKFEFISEDGDMLDRDLLHLRNDQYSNHWTVGSDNYLTVDYMGITTQVPVTIIENPVASISYTPVKPIELIVNTNGYWDYDGNNEKFYNYYNPEYSTGDVLTVTDKNGNSVDYIFDNNKWEFASEDGDILVWSCLNCYSEQYSNHWTLGSDNYYTIEYMGVAIQVPVSIIETPVESIEYKSNTPLKEGVDNYVVTDENGCYYNHYYAKCCVDDVFTVNYKNGTTKSYTACESSGDSYSDHEHIHFVSSDGEIIEYGYGNGNILVGYGDSEIYENRYQIGENTAVVKYLGVQAEYKFIIEPTDIVDFSVTPIGSTLISPSYDDADESYMYYEIPPFAVNITYSDNSTEQIICNDYDDINNAPINLNVMSDQYGETENGWELIWNPGEKHEFVVYCTVNLYDSLEVTIAGESTHAHTYNTVVTKPTCTEKGYTTYTCTICKDTYVSDYVDALGHKPVTDKAVAPTCTETGLTEGSHCANCGEVYVEQQVVEALGHKPVKDEEVYPTCTETGLTSGSHCSVCKTVLIPQSVVPALNHRPTFFDNMKIASCTEDGYTGDEICAVCGKVVQEGEVIPRVEYISISRSTITYTGTVQRPQVTVTDTEGNNLTYNEDFTVTWSNFNSKDVGTYTVEINLIGDYEDSRTRTYSIVPQTNVTPKLNRNTITYTGTVQRPMVTVTDVYGTQLVYNKDFKVDYSNWNSKEVGRYTVTVTMIGGYEGTFTYPYYINPKGTTFLTSAQGGFKGVKNGFTLKWNKQADQTTGYQIQYATKSDFSNAATIYAGPSSATSKTVTGRASKTRYYVRIRTYKNVGGKYFYSDWSTGTKSVVTL